jgi:hypothetical protein
MLDPFRYVFEDSLYFGFSEVIKLEAGRKVFGIICPDFNNYFEIIETGNQRSPYQPRVSQLNPFSEKVLEWFCDHQIIYDLEF